MADRKLTKTIPRDGTTGGVKKLFGLRQTNETDASTDGAQYDHDHGGVHKGVDRNAKYGSVQFY